MCYKTRKQPQWLQGFVWFTLFESLKKHIKDEAIKGPLILRCHALVICHLLKDHAPVLQHTCGPLLLQDVDKHKV